MEKYIEKDGKRLRLGYTTGSCAAAAAKAAAWMLLTGRRKETITLDTPKGIRLELAVREITMRADSVSCAIAWLAKSIEANVNNVFFIPILIFRLQSYAFIAV